MFAPFAIAKPVHSHSGAMSQHLGLVLHVQQGNGGLAGMFSNSKNQASSTWWVSKTGVIEQYVDSDLTAWAQAAGNSTYNSVETEGFTTEPLNDKQLEALAGIYAWGHEHYGWPLQLADKPGESGLGYHAMGGAAWGGHPCPGPIRIAQRADILARIGSSPMAAPAVRDIGRLTLAKTVAFTIKLGPDGNGWTDQVPGSFSKVAGVFVNGPYPPTDGYRKLPTVGIQGRNDQIVVTAEGGEPNITVGLFVTLAD